MKNGSRSFLWGIRSWGQTPPSSSSPSSSATSSMSTNRWVVVITGASRGLGRAMACAFGQHLLSLSSSSPWPQHVFYLMARSETGLNETKQALLDMAQNLHQPEALYVSTRVLDLGQLDRLSVELDDVCQDLSDLLSTSFSSSSPSNPDPTLPDLAHEHDRVILINNAGSLGFLGPAWNSPSLRDMQQTVDLNVTAALWGSVRLIQWARSLRPTHDVTLVNISSKVAVQPFPTMALYSAGKAARDAFHAALAQELDQESTRHTPQDGALPALPPMKVLNYAPGPLETDMATQLRSPENQLDPNLQAYFQRTLLDPTGSARVLVQLVVENSFTNGQHVDYYDVVTPITPLT